MKKVILGLSLLIQLNAFSAGLEWALFLNEPKKPQEKLEIPGSATFLKTDIFGWRCRVSKESQSSRFLECREKKSDTTITTMADCSELPMDVKNLTFGQGLAQYTFHLGCKRSP